jgi:hypothetical protein
MLSEALRWPVLVEVPDVFVEDRDGVGLVVDHIRSVRSSRTLRTNRSA